MNDDQDNPCPISVRYDQIWIRATLLDKQRADEAKAALETFCPGEYYVHTSENDSLFSKTFRQYVPLKYGYEGVFGEITRGDLAVHFNVMLVTTYNDLLGKYHIPVTVEFCNEITRRKQQALEQLDPSLRDRATSSDLLKCGFPSLEEISNAEFFPLPSELGDLITKLDWVSSELDIDYPVFRESINGRYRHSGLHPPVLGAGPNFYV